MYVLHLPATTACEHIREQVQSNMLRPRDLSGQLSPSKVYAPELLADVLQKNKNLLKQDSEQF